MNDVLTLYVSDLASKFGFADGDIVSDFCHENNIEIGSTSHKSILVNLVKSELLPLIPHVKCYEFSSCHNPIRCENEYLIECSTSFMSVDISQDALMLVIRKLSAEVTK
ncbi:hypothetical protein NFB56_16110 [Yersinia ruckeri]|uniref:hypothetical protein n=1 Tax=Yersinia ruckeri TaxID=29486 RepID=UPI0022372FE3|nr:hypothetical protein [Yersinia ruckeri]MCW6550363.1 hypothetical protein [Yersinia ruckeri]